MTVTEIMVLVMRVVDIKFLMNPFIHQGDHITDTLRNSWYIMSKATIKVNTLSSII